MGEQAAQHRRRVMVFGIGMVVVVLAFVVAVGLVAALDDGSADDSISDEERARRDPGRCSAPDRDGVYVRVVHGDPRDWCLYIDLENGRIVNPGEAVFAVPVE